MEYKQLGNTKALVPDIGLGTWAYTGGPGPLLRGIELGANLVDTAESYGTEEAVGQAIKGVRDEVLLATKVSPEHFRRDDVLKAADGSLTRLGVDYIDLYQLHWPNQSIPIEETMGAMESLVKAGKVRYIGVSNFSADQVKAAQAALSKAKIVSNQVEYSLVKRAVERELLAYCQQNGITVIAYSPLAVGLRNITNRDRQGALSRVAAETGKSEANVALNWLISQSGVMAIPKANSEAHVEENCAASGWRLSERQMNMLSRAFS